MADPFRLRVLKNLTTALEEIAIADGYEHDLDGKVFRGRRLFGENDALPLISILEVPIPLDQIDADSTANPNKLGPWGLMIQGFVEDDPDNPTDPAYRLLADVQKRLMLERINGSRIGETLGFKAVYDLTLGGASVRPADDVSSKAYFWLNFSITVVEDLSDPYN
jgi:hypothetical protein